MAGGDDKKLEAAKKAEAKPADLASEIQKRAKKLVSSMNSAFDAERKATVVAAKAGLEASLKKKAKDGKIDTKKLAELSAHLDANIPKFKMELDAMRVSASKRSGDDQGWYAIKKWSKTCRSAHLHHAAIHVKTIVTRGSKKAQIGLKDVLTYYPASFKPGDHLKKESWGVMSYGAFKKYWSKGLKDAVLADASGTKQTFQAWDPWHVELPSLKMKGIPADMKTAAPRPKYSDKEVIACIDHYAEYAAHVDAIEEQSERARHKKNRTIEKSYKRTFNAKYKLHKQKLDADKKKAAKDAAKKKKVADKIVKKVKTMKGRMDKTYDEIVELKKDGAIALP